MPTLTILKGLNQKKLTEEAKEILLKWPGTVRLSRQDLGETLFKGVRCGYEQNCIIAQAEHILLKFYLENQRDIVIDDLNLNQKHIERYDHLAQKYGYDLYIMPVDNSFEKTITDNINSPSGLSTDTIYNLAQQHGYRQQDKEYIVYDLDTLLDNRYRLDLATTQTGLCLDVFYDPDLYRCDTPIRRIMNELLADHEFGYEIIIISTRPESGRKEIEELIDAYQLPCSRLILREDLHFDHDLWLDKVINQYLDLNWCSKFVHSISSQIPLLQSKDLNVIYFKDLISNDSTKYQTSTS
jgi:hypothetical protein